MPVKIDGEIFDRDAAGRYRVLDQMRFRWREAFPAPDERAEIDAAVERQAAELKRLAQRGQQ